jgi:hypothetical protein
VHDASPAATEQYFELLRRAKPSERLRAAVGLSQAVRALAEAGLRARHPHADDDEIRVRLAVRMYGREAVARVFPFIPDDANGPSCTPSASRMEVSDLLAAARSDAET